jgi:predicted pyridoxine 5'-phosphate oxidase superfamily flavin-nucleotide-binding protein
MIFMIPGEEWTMRINGVARIVDEPVLLEQLSARGRAAQLAIEVKIEECYFHCPRSFKRAELWNAEKFSRYTGESWGTILARRTQLDPGKVEILDQRLAEGVKHLP